VDRSGKIPSKKWKKGPCDSFDSRRYRALLLAGLTVIPHTARDKDRARNVSLGIRLMISAMALLGCPAFGSVFVNWRTVGKVDTKIRAGLTVGADAVGNVVAPGRAGGPCEPPLGDRPSATITASTSLSASEPPPRWSYWVLARTSVVGRVDIPSLSNAVLLETDPYNEIGEASGDIVLSDAVLATLCALVLSMVHWTTGRALRPRRIYRRPFPTSAMGITPHGMAEHAPLELAQIRRG
jgi:hypothetical protein